MITNCSARDAHMFCVFPLHVVEFENTNKALGSWLERHRTAYFAMQNCIALLNRAQSGHENTGAANWFALPWKDKKIAYGFSRIYHDWYEHSMCWQSTSITATGSMCLWTTIQMYQVSSIPAWIMLCFAPSPYPFFFTNDTSFSCFSFYIRKTDYGADVLFHFTRCSFYSCTRNRLYVSQV